jgi:hypothetical protein
MKWKDSFKVNRDKQTSIMHVAKVDVLMKY